MSGSVLRVVCVVISALLFIFACNFGDRSGPGPIGSTTIVSLGFLVAGSVALITAAMVKPDK